MTTNHHSAYPFGGPLSSLAMEAPLGQLDAAIGTVIAASSGTSTSLTAQANGGQASLVVASSTGFAIGDPIYIGTGALFESRIILAVPDSTHITVSVNLTNTYAIGQPVSKSSAEIVDARGGMANLGARLSAIEFAVNAKYYGAVGDGSTDNAAAVQAAIAAVSAAGGGTVFFPTGTYQFVGQLTIPSDNIRFKGAGAGATILRRSGAGALFVNSNTANTRYRFGLEDLTFNGQGGATAGGVKLENFYNALIERVVFENFGGIGVEFYGTGSTYHNIVRDCFFTLPVTASTGIKFTSGAADPNANQVVNCAGTCVAAATLINIAGGGTNLISGVNLEGAGPTSVLLTIAAIATWTRVIGCRFENGSVTIAAADSQLIGCTYATTVTLTITGLRSRSIMDGSLRSCILTNTAAPAIVTGTLTKLLWNTEVSDDWTAHVAASGDIVIPAGTQNSRIYRVSARVLWDANATGLRLLNIQKNGATVSQSAAPGPKDAAERFSQDVFWVGPLVPTDIITAHVQQNSGGNLNINGVFQPLLTLEQVI